jgi:hypothetical protein
MKTSRLNPTRRNDPRLRNRLRTVPHNLAVPAVAAADGDAVAVDASRPSRKPLPLPP